MLFAILAHLLITTTLCLAERTLDNLEQRSSALIEQENFIEDAIINIAEDYGQYTSYMAKHNMEFPQALMQFYVYMTAETDSDFPTSLFASQFPFTDFYTYITAFPWYTSLLEEAGATTFYLPEHYATVPETTSSETSSESSTSVTSSPSPTSQSNASETFRSTSTFKSTTTVSTGSSSSKCVATSTESQTSNGASLLKVPYLLFTLLVALLY